MSPWKYSNLKQRQKKCFHVYPEEKKNEAVGLFTTFLAQGITRDKWWYKMIINTITQIPDKTTNAAQD